MWKKLCWKTKQFCILYKQKFSNLRPFLQGFQKSKSLDIGLPEVGAKRHLNRVNKWKKICKKSFFAAAILNPWWAKVFKSETTSFHYFSPRICPKTNFLCAAIWYPFLIKLFKSETNSSITFPQGFRVSKTFGHPTSESGGKKKFKHYLKSEQTDRQTHRHTETHMDKLTYR